MKKILSAALAAVFAASLLTGCGSSAAPAQTEAASQAEGNEAGKEAAEESSEKAGEASSEADADAASTEAQEAVSIKIGASPSPHAEILEKAKDALEKEGISIEIVTYNDYVQPNLAVDQGEIDANYFQHQPYLDDFNKENKTNVVSVGKIHYEPFGIYAGKSDDLSNIADGAQIAVPNDTTNEARALLLLQDNGIITLKDGAGLTATKQDIVDNPHNVDILEVEAAQIPRSLDSVDFAAMNGNYAIDAGFKPSDALVQEKSDSEAAQTYGNVVAVAEANKDQEWAKKLVEVLKSQEISDFIAETYEGGVIAIN